jgi:predicted nucleotidyltransferase
MSIEDTLVGWTGPSSDTEQDKQERTERMVREAIADHDAFASCSLSVYAKGSYANNTNVRSDSDVDIAVQCHEVIYYEVAEGASHEPGNPYEGEWTKEKLRTEVGAALRAKFPGQVDETGKVAISVHSTSSRVDADVVPCFDYLWYVQSGGSIEGTRVFPKTGLGFENYPKQQLANGNSKNTRTNYNYKKAVRVMKRIENAMVDAKYHREVPSYFIECLVYNCPPEIFGSYSWTSRTKGILVHIWESLQGDDEPDEDERWLEVNRIKYLFHSAQKWSRKDGRDFAYAAWNYLEFS